MSTLPDVVVSATGASKPATFKISDFKSSLGKLARPNLFRAKIYGPGKIGSIPEFSFRCEKAEFPGKSVATVDDPGGGGPTLKLPYDVTYNDIVLSIICSADMAERIYFENWINLIVRPAGNGGGFVRYHSNYSRGQSLEVEQLDEQNKILLRWVMEDIYPIAISPMNALWDEINTYQRFEVTLTYRHYQIETA
jgi:hypothetical protein